MSIHMFRLRRSHVLLLIATLSTYAGQAQSFTFDLDYFGGITGALNTNITLGAQFRLQDPDPNIVSIGNSNPPVCRSLCQPHLSTAPGDVDGRVQLGLEAEGSAVVDALRGGLGAVEVRERGLEIAVDEGSHARFGARKEG